LYDTQPPIRSSMQLPVIIITTTGNQLDINTVFTVGYPGGILCTQYRSTSHSTQNVFAPSEKIVEVRTTMLVDMYENSVSPYYYDLCIIQMNAEDWR
jgi:hypothetical protein